MSFKLINKVVVITISFFLLSMLELKAQSKIEISRDSLETAVVIDSITTVVDSLCITSEILDKLGMIDSITLARIKVINNTKVQISKKKDVKIDSYRIRIYFDNNQNARAQALKIEASFKLDFPEVPVYLNYNAPYFNVTVGDFLTYQEALGFLRKLTRDFPKAFVVPHKSFVTTFGTKKESDSLTNI